MRVHLTVKAGPHEGRVFEFEGHSNFFVGRSKQAHFRLPDHDKFISRIHFMVEVNPPLCRLTDLGSTNGTLVNDRKVTTADLKDGDTIRAGKTVLGVSVTETDSPSAPTAAEPSRGRAEPAAATPIQLVPLTVPVPVPVVTMTAVPSPLLGASAGRSPGALSPGTGTGTVSCRACAALLTRTETAPAADPTASDVCPSCREQMVARPQTVPGYRLVKELGRGGMGVVYLALRDADGSRVALKTIKPEVDSTDADVRRFLREARILGGLDHPNIVAFHEMGETHGMLFFAMDYVAGVDASRLQKALGGPMAVPRAVGLVCQVLQALDYAHAKGFVHRDIKPANLLVVNEAGREAVKVTDFGLARVYQCSKMSGLTLKGDLAGTVAFMAPEQITDLRDALPSVDQYSAAATLYKFLTDRHIYDLTGRLEQQIMKVLLEDPVPIQARRPGLPDALAAVIHRALARDPSARFKDVQEMRRALAPFAH